MKALFLDFDGVLNSNESAHKHGSYDIFMPEAIGFIQQIAAQGVEIVVSSTWRKTRSHDQLSALLGVKVYSKTPILDVGPVRVSRGEEIAYWIKHHYELERYAIIDDDSDMLDEQRPFFIKTNFLDGMQVRHYIALCELLDIPIMVGFA